MDPSGVVLLLVTGVSVGLASGMLGVGGCFIMVPVQLWLMTSMGVDPTIAIRVAFGTNLAVVLPTALSSAYGHGRRGAVIWYRVIPLGTSSMLAAVMGAWVASSMPGDVLIVAFGLAILLGALGMVTARPIEVEGTMVEGTPPYIVIGSVIGFVSGLIGICGGVLLIPAMLWLLRFRMHDAVGTASAVMALTVIGGLLSYVYNGSGVSGLPDWSIGYVNLEQLVLLAGTSVPMALVGARVAHGLSPNALRWAFVAVMVYMGLRMLGLFDLFGLPL